MRQVFNRHGFVLVELLVVIAIIGAIIGLLVPATQPLRPERGCMSNLRVLSRALQMHAQDTGSYPDSLMPRVDEPGGNAPVPTGGLSGPLSPYLPGWDVFRCPDNHAFAHERTVNAHIPDRPSGWLARYGYIGDSLPCPRDDNGRIDCSPDGIPRRYYTWDSYDITPHLDASGRAVLTPAGDLVCDSTYRLDWTGRWGPDDLRTQLKYPDAPPDQTLVTYCAWHAAAAESHVVPVLLLNGSALPFDLNRLRALDRGP